MQITLPKLPYPDNALEPHILRTTLQVHHGQHHRVYVENVRTLAKQVRLADRPLEHILRQTAGQDGQRALFNNADQAWNYAFYWRFSGGVPVGEIAKRIDSDFGGRPLRRAVPRRCRRAIWQRLGLAGARRQYPQGDPDRKRRHTACLWQTPLLTIDVWRDFAGASGTAQKKRRFAG